MGSRAMSCFVKDYEVQYHEIDQRGFARPLALLNYLQSAAGEHATMLGVAVADLRKSGHTWVMSRLHLVMERYPRGADTIRIRTWPATRNTLFTVRDFELFDMDGALIGRATTSWAVLNLKTRRPVKLVSVLPMYPLNPERALNDTFSTLPFPERTEYELRLPVLRGDLDINRHVNNTVYAGWALETIPEDVDNSCRLAAIEIGFRSEVLYGDTIVARSATAAEPGCYLHCIESAGDGRELARLRTRWLPFENAHQ
ncbi:MAG: acyl-ACP thioesterase [Proteobacteria bacterium]|nr:acyl-ACP thioesterase [Pseudomonadota bacterium]